MKLNEEIKTQYEESSSPLTNPWFPSVLHWRLKIGWGQGRIEFLVSILGLVYVEFGQASCFDRI